MRKLMRAWAAWLVVLPFGAALGFAVVSIPAGAPGLASLAEQNLAMSGVDNPVTAVLMNFRSYDTLLELSVMFLALLGVWSFPPLRAGPLRVAGPVLRVLNQFLVPFLILFAAYLLWVGSHAPGGAFQAGAVIGAAGVLLTLSGEPLPVHAPRFVQRTLAPLGLATFLIVGAATFVSSGRLLDYPPRFAKPLIMLIETAAALSIGVTLLAVFRGGRPHIHPGKRS